MDRTLETMLHGIGNARGGDNDVAMLSTHKTVPAYRCDLSFILRDERMYHIGFRFGE
jgi:hypothetical protein